jgi:hypothetical protein
VQQPSSQRVAEGRSLKTDTLWALGGFAATTQLYYCWCRPSQVFGVTPVPWPWRVALSTGIALGRCQSARGCTCWRNSQMPSKQAVKVISSGQSLLSHQGRCTIATRPPQASEADLTHSHQTSRSSFHLVPPMNTFRSSLGFVIPRDECSEELLSCTLEGTDTGWEKGITQSLMVTVPDLLISQSAGVCVSPPDYPKALPLFILVRIWDSWFPPDNSHPPAMLGAGGPGLAPRRTRSVAPCQPFVRAAAG